MFVNCIHKYITTEFKIYLLRLFTEALPLSEKNYNFDLMKKIVGCL
jgi:hypothetical protein